MYTHLMRAPAPRGDQHTPRLPRWLSAPVRPLLLAALGLVALLATTSLTAWSATPASGQQGSHEGAGDDTAAHVAVSLAPPEVTLYAVFAGEQRCHEGTLERDEASGTAIAAIPAECTVAAPTIEIALHAEHGSVLHRAEVERAALDAPEPPLLPWDELAGEPHPDHITAYIESIAAGEPGPPGLNGAPPRGDGDPAQDLPTDDTADEPQPGATATPAPGDDDEAEDTAAAGPEPPEVGGLGLADGSGVVPTNSTGLAALFGVIALLALVTGGRLATAGDHAPGRER